MSRISRKGNGRGHSSGNSKGSLHHLLDPTNEDEKYDNNRLVSGDQERLTNAITTDGPVTETSVPNFLLKLWKLVEDKTYDFCISWDSSGCSFHVWEPYTFSKDVLPLFFKHSNLNSFIRQLNMYGFRKVTNLEQGALKHPSNDMDSLEFHHQYFIRGRPDLLPLIKRKSTNSRTPAGELVDIKPGEASIRNFNHAMDEIKQLRDKQRGMDARLHQVKRENQTLWQELSRMRELHMKQQQVVNKLIHFFMRFVQPGSGGRIDKRKILAIGSGTFGGFDQPNDIYADQPAKRPRVDSSDAVDIIADLEETLRGNQSHQGNNVTTGRSSHSHLVHSGNGPTIADITDESAEPFSTSPINDLFMSGYARPAVPLQSEIGGEHAADESSFSPNIVPLVENEAVSQQQAPNLNWQMAAGPSQGSEFLGIDPQVIAGTSSAANVNGLNPSPEWTKPDFSEYVDGVQADLDTLQDYLLSEDMDMDGSLLDDLFSSPQNNQSNPPGTTAPYQGDIVGNEVQVYKPPEYLLDTGLGSESGGHSQGTDGTTVTDPGVFVTTAAPDPVSHVPTVPASPLITPVTSPCPSRPRVPQTLMDAPQQQQRQANVMDTGGRRNADDVLRSAIVKSKSSKRR